MLPKDPTFWIVVAVGIVIVVALAIWFGRGFEIGKWYIRVKAADSKKDGGVSVLNRAKMSQVKVGGSIVGTQISGSQGDRSAKNVSVLDKSKMTDVDVGGDIMGEKKDGGTSGKT